MTEINIESFYSTVLGLFILSTWRCVFNNNLLKCVILELFFFLRCAQIFIIFALVCCLAVLTVSSAKWTDEDDTEVDEFDGDDEFFMDDEDKTMLYEDILDELIAASDPRNGRCGKICKLCKTRCTRGKPKPPKVIRICQKKCENPRNWLSIS